MRRSFRTRLASRRKRPRTFWVRQAFNNAAPGAQNDTDLLAGYLTTTGLLASANELVVERIHLLVAVVFTVATAGANNGVSIAVWVDSRNQARLSAQANPYDQQFLVFDEAYVGEALQNGGVTPFNIVKRYDVRARRKIPSVTDTLWLQLSQIGTITLTSYSVVQSVLLRSS